MNLMKISPEGTFLIKTFEGCRLTAYKPVPTERYWTIGIGHYGPDVKKGQVITSERAVELFHGDILPIEQQLNAMGINFKQCQFDALVSWIFNLGSGNFNSSTLKKKIIARAKDEEVTDQMVKWVNSGGVPLLGLKRRRIAEANMFLGTSLYRLDTDNNIVK